MTIDGNKLMMLLNDWWYSSFGYDEETEDSKAIKTVMDEIEKNLKNLIPESCEDAISRADAVKVASGYCHPSNIAKELAKLPPVTPKPETAHWIKVPGEETFFCSKCNCRLDDEQTYLPLNFCPNCGRKMVEPQESEKSK